MTDPFLLKILGDASRGSRTYVAGDSRVPAFHEFEVLAQTAKRAHEDGLVEASFDGRVRSFVVDRLTREGLVRWAKLNLGAEYDPRH